MRVPAGVARRDRDESRCRAPARLTAIVVFSFVFYMIFARFREQAGVLACPDGRVMSSLIDARTVSITYDRPRGEPRSRLVRGGSGPATAPTAISASPCVCPARPILRRRAAVAPVYAAVTAGTAMDDTGDAALLMVGFGLATTPALVVMSMAPAFVPIGLRRRSSRLRPWLLAATAVLLLARGLWPPTAPHTHRHDITHVALVHGR